MCEQRIIKGWAGFAWKKQMNRMRRYNKSNKAHERQGKYKRLWSSGWQGGNNSKVQNEAVALA